jgi:hypothetical protein
MAKTEQTRLRPNFKLLRVFRPATEVKHALPAYEFGFQTISGKSTVLLTLAQVDSAPDLKAALASRGFSASAAGLRITGVQELLNRLINSERAGKMEAWTLADATGWWGRGFLLPNESLPADARLLLNPAVPYRPEASPARAGSAVRAKGALLKARHSSAAVAGTCAAMSAVCLPFRLGRAVAGYAVVFSGPTSTGKTWTTRVATSVVSDPSRLLPFRASEAGLEETAQAHRHIPLVLDEPKSTRTGHGEVAKHLAYLIEGGAPALLHSTRQPTRLRIETVVLTGAEDGSFGERSGGEQVRFFEIPCAPMGPFGVIDQYKAAGVADAAAAGQWVQDILTELEGHHGHALPTLAGYVVSLGDKKTRQALETHSKEFLRHATKRLGSTDTAGNRTRSAFAFFYASGLLGVAAKALPWSAKRVRGSVLRCLRWHEALMKTNAASNGSGTELASRKLVAVLRERAETACIPSAAALKKHGAVYDSPKREVRATYAFLREQLGGKKAVKACLDLLAAQNVTEPGDKPPAHLRQVRYTDGPLRVVCFKLDELQVSQLGAATPGGFGPLPKVRSRRPA